MIQFTAIRDWQNSTEITKQWSENKRSTPLKVILWCIQSLLLGHYVASEVMNKVHREKMYLW